MPAPHYIFVCLLIALSLSGCPNKAEKAESSAKQTTPVLNAYVTRDSAVELRLPTGWETAETYLQWHERTFPERADENRKLTQSIALKTGLAVGNRRSDQVIFITHGQNKQDLDGINNLTDYVDEVKQEYIKGNVIAPSAQAQSVFVNGMHGIHFSQIKTNINKKNYEVTITFIEHKYGFFEILTTSPSPPTVANAVDNKTLLNAVYSTGQPIKPTYSAADNLPIQKLTIGKRYQMMIPTRWAIQSSKSPESKDGSNCVIVYVPGGLATVRTFSKSQLPPTADLNRLSIASRMAVLEQQKWLTQFDTPQAINVNGMQGVRYQAKGISQHIKMQVMLSILEGKNEYYQVLLMATPTMFSTENDALQAAIKTLRPVDPAPQ